MTKLLEDFKPSSVNRPLFSTVWQNSEWETVAENILKLARYSKDNQWESFTWEDYVRFCSHKPSELERSILDEFASTGYLSKDSDDVYHFEQKILGVYMQYCEKSR